MYSSNQFRTYWESNWKFHIEDMTNRPAAHFIETYFKDQMIETPTIEQIIEITEEEIMESWLSIQSAKALLLFQQSIKNQLNHEEAIIP